MDATQYKDYILTLLFVKYVTDKAKSDPNSLIEVPRGGAFDDMVALKGDKEIGDKVNKIIGKLAEANNLQKVIDVADFNDEEKLGSGKEMQDRLSKLVTIFNDLDFRGSRAEGDDLLGDAYEYLMRHFATESGKSKGQFYTPAEVSRVLAKVIGIGPHTRQDQTVYDPTCGSGSLLLKAASEAPRGITIYGQEKDVATWALCKMNMILHSNEDADIARGDTLTSPHFTKGGQLRAFDFVVMNPPFSTKSWSNGLENEFGRFDGFGRPPAKNGDYAFLLHVIKSLKSTGKAAVILPHGVLYRGNAEAIIRKELLKRGYIQGIIGLPANLFYGTGIPACIVVIDKENAQARTGVFMIDAAKGFMKDGPKNRLRSQDIHKIVDVFTKQTEIDRYSRMVPLAEIADLGNDYNLNISRYIDTSDPEDIQDLDAHLHGGIPDRDLDALGGYWDAFPQLRGLLFSSNRPGYSDLTIDVSQVEQAILDSPEVQKLATEARDLTAEWFDGHRGRLAEIDTDTEPTELIVAIGDDLLARFKAVALLDEYDVYEQLMTYWHEVMHDDVFVIMHEGWDEAAKPRKTIADKDRKLSESPDLVIGSGRGATKYKMDLIPPALIVARYFPNEQAKIDELTVAAGEAARVVEEYVVEHAVEDGLLAAAMEEDKISKALTSARLKLARLENDSDPGEIKALAHLLRLYNDEAAARKAVKDAQAALDLAILKKYGDLTAYDIRSLVLDSKWARSISSRVARLVLGMLRGLSGRIGELGRRYESSLAEIDAELATLRLQIASSLSAMGADQLLTGEQRLPGFTQPWREVALGNHVTYVKTVGLSRAQLDAESPTKYLHYGDIHTRTSIFLDAAREAMPRAKAELLRNAGRLRVGDLIFADASEDADGVGKSVEIVAVPADGVVAGLHTIAARFGKGVLADGFKAYLQFIPGFRNALLRLAAGTKVLATTRRYISSITLRLPEVDEQLAIVAVLRRMDHEIDLTRSRLAKSQAMEIGMRQELLVGRTRLSAAETAS